MRHGFVRLPALIAALVIVSVLGAVAAAAPAQSGSAVQLIALDADPSGNTATSLGHLDPCIRTGPGQEVTVDLVVDAVPKDRPLVGWGVGVKYDSDLLEVTAADKAFLLAADGAFEPFDVSDTLPDSDGVYSMSIADLASYNPEGGNSETGPGVLARLTFRSKSPGLATVIPGYPTLIDFKNSTIDVRTIASIHIAVGQECPPGPDIQPTSLPPPPTLPPPPSPTGDVTPEPTPPHLHSTIGLVAMDADPAGNTPTGLGHLDPCVHAEPGSEVTVDTVVDAVPADRPVVGFQIGINYSGGLMAIAEDNHFLLGANGIFQPFSGLSDPLPDADGHLAIIVADLASNDPGGANMETGPGVLSRVTFRTTHPGIFDLAPGFRVPDEYPALIDLNNDTIEVRSIAGIKIAVGQDCPPGLTEIQPTPLPPISSLQGTPTPTPVVAASPTPTPSPTEDPPPTPAAAPAAFPATGGSLAGGVSLLTWIAAVAGALALACAAAWAARRSLE